MEEWTKWVERLSEVERQETARLLLEELNGQTMPVQSVLSGSQQTRTTAGKREYSDSEENRMAAPMAPSAWLPTVRPFATEEIRSESVSPMQNLPASQDREILLQAQPDGRIVMRRKLASDGVSVRSGQEQMTSAAEQEPTGSAFERMREISDYFRRDTRRYDPGYARY